MIILMREWAPLLRDSFQLGSSKRRICINRSPFQASIANCDLQLSYCAELMPLITLEFLPWQMHLRSTLWIPQRCSVDNVHVDLPATV